MAVGWEGSALHFPVSFPRGMPVIPRDALPVHLGLQGVQVSSENSRGARKLARIPWLSKKKEAITTI